MSRSDDPDNANQTVVPDSFVALYRDARERLTASRETIATRHELCDDMANMLTEHCSMIHFRDGIDEAEVLRRVQLGLLASPTTVEPREAEWVVRRTAELLDWPDPRQANESRATDSQDTDSQPNDGRTPDSQITKKR